MNIQEEREFILSENNTAQQRVIDLLETLIPTSMVDLNISDPLSGEIDFSILDSMGFKKIRSIHLGKGKITDISHIPKTVTQLFCENNILVSLENLPSTIKEIHCSHNHISQIELTGLSALTILDCAHNELAELQDIPVSIQRIYCDNNYIVQLDLDNLVNLKALHCSNNKLMIIKNLPIQLEDLKMESNPMAEIDHIARGKSEKKAYDDEVEVKIDLVEALHKYFRLKQSYESKRLDIMRNAYNSAKTKRAGKQKAAKAKIPCINCKQSGGTVFTVKDNKYIALCGNMETPCNLNIQIFCGYCFNRESILYSYQEILNNSKESIIQQKLDTLFNYISESQSAKIFKKEFDNYTRFAQLYKDFLSEWEDIYKNMHRSELFTLKQNEIYELLERIQSILNEYKQTDNPELLRAAVELQVDELIPKIEFLRKIKYEIMEMEEDNCDSVSKTCDARLVQRETPLSKIDYSLASAEPSHVIKFVKK